MRPIAVLAVLVALALAGAAEATAPPVASIPRGPSTTVATVRGELVSVALPHRVGKSWRLARNGNPRVLRQVSEADVGNAVVLVFEARRRGKATVVFALTRGETAKAFASRTYSVTVR